jgi:uncharacterized metal-binding protein YceD (DUF177 family)
MSEFPIAHPFELGRLSLAGDEVRIAPSTEELARIAEWADVASIEAMNARIELRKLTPTRYVFDVHLVADIVQSCVVTLEPVRSRVDRTFARDLVLTPSAGHVARQIEIDVAAVDDEGLEEIPNLRYDLAVPVLEELALAIDPYPRKAGVAFETPPDDADSPAHPFAALERLKKPS